MPITHRRLLSIGHNLDERRRDASYYDLLASEARFSVFVAIAQGQRSSRKGQSANLGLVYGIGDSRDATLGLAEKYQDQRTGQSRLRQRDLGERPELYVE